VIVSVIVRLFWAPYMRRVLPGIAAEAERAEGRGSEDRRSES
jgi:hypothetical protein